MSNNLDTVAAAAEEYKAAKAAMEAAEAKLRGLLTGAPVVVVRPMAPETAKGAP